MVILVACSFAWREGMTRETPASRMRDHFETNGYILELNDNDSTR